MAQVVGRYFGDQYNVKLTGASHDGGVDLWVNRKGEAAHDGGVVHECAVQVKRYPTPYY